MTSLEFIMDMDVDKDDPQNNKRDPSSSTSVTRRDRNHLASEHAHPEDHQERLDIVTKQRRGTSGRHTKSSTIATAESSTTASSSSSTAWPAPARGNSNTSNEDMYRHGSHGSGSGSGGGEQPNRPMGNLSGDVPIKLTPITGRVSRAKKGVPVHTCDICRPPKTFTRAEHLRRHQLSHQTPQYPCNHPGCDRAFHRADLLARHATRHDQEGDNASLRSRGTTRDNSRRTSATSTSGGYEVPQGASQNSMHQTPDMTSAGQGYGGNTTYYNTGSGQPMSPPQPRDHHDNSYQSPPGGSNSSYTHTSPIPHINQPPNMGGSNGGLDYNMTAFQTPRTTPHSGLLIVTTGLAADSTPGLLAPDLSPWASSDSNFSTPSDNSHRRPFVPNYSPPTSSSEWPVNTYVPTYTPTSQGIQSPHMDMISSGPPFFTDPWVTPSYSTGMIDPSMPMYSEDHHYLNHPQSLFSSVRSPTPPNISSSVQSAESLVTIAPAPHDAQVLAGRFKGQAAFMGNLSGAAFLTAVTLPKATRDAIPQFLDVYWKRFDTLFPLIHRQRFELAPDEILRAAMAAMGSQFLEGKEDRIRGNQLHEWAWQEVKRVSWPIAPRASPRVETHVNQQLQILQWNVSTMQTILLCEIFARFRGKRTAIKPSEPFRSLYSRVGSTIQSDHGASFESMTSASSGGPPPTTPRGRWMEWIDAEARGRLLAACFVLDVHTSVYYDLPLMQQFTKPCPPIPLTAASQSLWNATPEEWDAITTANPITLEPTFLSEDAIPHEGIANAPALDQAVFLASEALRLPKRSNKQADLFKAPDLGSVERILALFPGSGVAYTYSALHFTPLHDLLAVSGDSWLFTQKILEGKAFLQNQKTLKQWSGSLQAATAAQFAAKALIAFLTTNDNDNPAFSSSSPPQKRRWNMADVSDYWAIYICALICWALGHRGASASSSQPAGGGNNNNNSNANEAERDSELEALNWLHRIAGLGNPQDVLTTVSGRGRGVIIGVVAMVRRRLEGEAIGGRSRLLVDAVGVLKKLEEGVNWKWF